MIFKFDKGWMYSTLLLLFSTFAIPYTASLPVYSLIVSIFFILILRNHLLTKRLLFIFLVAFFYSWKTGILSLCILFMLAVCCIRFFKEKRYSCILLLRKDNILFCIVKYSILFFGIYTRKFLLFTDESIRISTVS